MAQDEERILYNFEYERRVRACFIGAGGHAYRNIYPAFRYAPVELAAVCDLDGARAAAVGKLFGAGKSYEDHKVMLAEERPEAVFIVTGYTPEGAMQSTPLALDAMDAGAHVWMEKPTAATSAAVRALIAKSAQTGRFVMTGLKKVFFPTIAKAKEIISSPSFGAPSSIYVRYPQHLPPFAARTDKLKMLSFLDHIYHPAAILYYLMGPIERLSYEWEPSCGASVAAIRFKSGAVGTLHLAAGQSGSSPLERLEVVGRGANLVVENGVKLTYYRRAKYAEYGRSPSFIQDEDAAPIVWQPEFSLGNLSNSNLFTLGYAQEVRAFCESVLTGAPPVRGALKDSLEIMKLFDAYRDNDSGQAIAMD